MVVERPRAIQITMTALLCAVFLSSGFIPSLTTNTTASHTGLRDWHIDATTLLEWRQLTESEIDDSAWDNVQSYAFRDYGNLDDFDTELNVTITVIANDTVFDVTFDYIRNHTATFATMFSAPEQDVPGPGPDDFIEELEHRIYHGVSEDGHSWRLAKTVGAPHIHATGAVGGLPVTVQSFAPSLGLPVDMTNDDLFSQIPKPCLDGGGGSTGGGIGVTDPMSACPIPIMPPMPDEPVFGDVGHHFFYGGELDWCVRKGVDEDAETGKAAWAAAIAEKFEETEQAFEPTAVNPLGYVAGCYFPTNSDHTPSHDVNYRHNHAADHPYEFNTVPGDHECQEYMDNVEDYLTHLSFHYDPTGEWPDVSKFQVVHHKACYSSHPNHEMDVGGLADRPGSHSITTEETWTTPSYTSAHEFGHNFGAVHIDADCLEDDPTLWGLLPPGSNPPEFASFTTLMGTPDGTFWNPDDEDTKCVDAGETERVNVFSDDNKSTVDSHA